MADYESTSESDSSGTSQTGNEDGIQRFMRMKDVMLDLNTELESWQRAMNAKMADEQEDFEAEIETTEEEQPIGINKFVETLLKHPWFDRGIMFIILINAVFIAVDLHTDDLLQKSTTNFKVIFEGLDVAFLSIYLIEFMMKLYNSPRAYWKSRYNLFDFVILVISFSEYLRYIVKIGVVQNVQFFRLLRAMRAMRALRSIGFIRPMRVIVSAIWKTMPKVRDILGLLLLVIFIFGICGYYFFITDSKLEASVYAHVKAQEIEGATREHNQAPWRNIGSAMYTCWVYVCCDGWVSFQQTLEDQMVSKNSRFFSVLVIFIGNFIFTNLFIGVIIKNLDEAQEEENNYQKAKRIILMKAKKNILLVRHQLENDNIFDTKDKSWTVKERIEAKFNQLRTPNRTDESIHIYHMNMNPLWLRCFATTLRLQEWDLFRLQSNIFSICEELAELTEKKTDMEAREHGDEKSKDDEP